MLFDELPTRSREFSSRRRSRDSAKQAEAEECFHAKKASHIHKTVTIQFPARREVNARVSRWDEPGMKQRHLLSLLRSHRMKCLLRRMLDETEFLTTTRF